MLTEGRETAVLIIGLVSILAALQNVQDVLKKMIVLQLLFFMGIGAQVATQVYQYYNAVEGRKSLERDTAFVLYAYTENDVPLLKAEAANNNYILAYRLFRNGDVKNAMTYLTLSREKDKKFVAESHYLLAYMMKLEAERNEEGPPEDVWAHLDAAINEDKGYGAPYYLRAILRVERGEKPEALDDLRMAVQMVKASCEDVNDDDEIRTVWSKLAEDPVLAGQFRSLQEKCVVTHRLQFGADADVRGAWRGSWREGLGSGSVALDVRKLEGKLTGTLRVTGSKAFSSGPIEGSVRGELFRFRGTKAPFNGRLRVKDDHMAGPFLFGFDDRSIDLRRTR